jgi:Protein of unknown function (DUF2721)
VGFSNIMPESALPPPVLLFPAVPLLRVAYTNHFNDIFSRIRSMSVTYKATLRDSLMAQIQILRERVKIILYM